MASDIYTPQEWKNGIEGGTPTSAKRFNHIESGIDALDDALSDLEASVTYIADTKTPQDRKITTGAGLKGGGDLYDDRTLAADFGTSSGTVCQGNDSRLANQRTPTDGSVTEAKLADDVKATLSNATGSADYQTSKVLSQSEYDAIGANTDPNTMYYVYE